MQAELARPNQNQIIDQELRMRTDTETWLAETLHGSMQTSFEFGYDGEFIRGEDGGSLDEIFDDSIAVAREITEHSPNMLFELRRRLIERGELDEMYGMVNGELPNTMLVVSDFPEELKNETEDIGGYNTDRQQTMARIIVFNGGEIKITTISLDGSNRKALEAIYTAFGHKPQDGELLGQRIHLDMPEEWQAKLPNIIRDAYDDSLEQQTGDHYYAGIKQSPEANIVNTHEFVRAQQDLIDYHVRLQRSDPIEAKKQRYNLAATMAARHKKHLAALNNHEIVLGEINPADVINYVAIDKASDGGSLQNEMYREGRRAANMGKVFSGCGETEDANEADVLSTDEQTNELGYNRLSSSNTRGGRCRFKSKECPKCHKKDVWTTVTDTHIEGDCKCKVTRKPTTSQTSRL